MVIHTYIPGKMYCLNRYSIVKSDAVLYHILKVHSYVLFHITNIYKWNKTRLTRRNSWNCKHTNNVANSIEISCLLFTYLENGIINIRYENGGAAAVTWKSNYSYGVQWLRFLPWVFCSQKEGRGKPMIRWIWSPPLTKLMRWRGNAIFHLRKGRARQVLH